MRVSTAAIYTLAALVARDVTQVAIAGTVPPTVSEEPEAGDVISARVASPTAIASITPPEQITLTGTNPVAERAVSNSQAVDIRPDTNIDTRIVFSKFEPGVDQETLQGTSAIASPETVLLPERIAIANSPIRQSDTAASISQSSTDPVEIPDSPGETVQEESEPTPPVPSLGEVQELQRQLRSLQPPADFGNEYEGSPAITVAVPSGFGADDLEGFVSIGYQSRTRFSNEDDGTMAVGIGFGDARRSVGVQLSYTVASFGGNRDFGSGGFNARVHRQLSRDWSAALGWEGFLNIGDDNDFENSVFGSITHIVQTQPDLNAPFSRIALTAGVGSGRFRTEEAIADGKDSLGVFGSMAIRVVRPVSALVEWTGQDLAVGLSIVPIRGLPLVITPALRDIAGAGDGTRFVIGTGISFQL